MTTKDEDLNLVPENESFVTPFRHKQNTTSVYLDIHETPPQNRFIIKIIGRKENDLVNYTYNTDYFSVEGGKKYMLYNLSPPNTDVRLEFQGPYLESLRGVWSPDSVPDEQAITIGPEFNSKQPNTKDEYFSFTASFDGQEFTTNFRQKNTTSTIYINVSNSSSLSQLAELRILVKNGNVVKNLSLSNDGYYLIGCHKYEVMNIVKENNYKEVALSFKLNEGDTIECLWSPDCSPESDLILI